MDEQATEDWRQMEEAVDRWRDDRTSGKDFVACAWGGDEGCGNGV